MRVVKGWTYDFAEAAVELERGTTQLKLVI